MDLHPLHGVAPSSGAPISQKLVKSAREFEAILLQSWLEKMNQGFIGSEDSQDPAHDTVSSLGTQAIATALVARGGIGIASMLVRKLQPEPATYITTPDPAPAVKGNGHRGR